MNRSKKIIWVDEQTHRVAKSVSSLQGLSINEYIAKKVNEDAKDFGKQFQQIPQKKRRSNFDFPF